MKVYPLTDAGNAERLVARFGQDIRYCPRMGWLAWNGQRWLLDEADKINHLALQMARGIPEEGQLTSDQNFRERIYKWAHRSESSERLQAAVKVARSDPRLLILPADLDADPWLLNAVNGTIDLRTGDLREHNRADCLTKICPTPHDLGAKAPLWDKFLAEVQPHEEIRDYLQRLVGYSMVGKIYEHILPICYGGGRNGKGTFFTALETILGDYATTIPTELLVNRTGTSHPTERMTLMGTRFAIASETEYSDELKVALVKSLTGGDMISARYMRRDFIRFAPTHQLWLQTNNRPLIRETTNAIWRRVKFIPWDIEIPEEKLDPALGERLLQEAPGILLWALNGCLEWQKSGLGQPESISTATVAYRDQSDSVRLFIDEQCFQHIDATVSATTLYSSYAEWAKDCGTRPIKRIYFQQRLQALGFVLLRPNINGERPYLWRGLCRHVDAPSQGLIQQESFVN